MGSLVVPLSGTLKDSCRTLCNVKLNININKASETQNVLQKFRVELFSKEPKSFFLLNTEII